MKEIPLTSQEFAFALHNVLTEGGPTERMASITGLDRDAKVNPDGSTTLTVYEDDLDAFGHRREPRTPKDGQVIGRVYKVKISVEVEERKFED
jgi:hypothetical protein